jgi:hypothetical protein
MDQMHPNVCKVQSANVNVNVENTMHPRMQDAPCIMGDAYATIRGKKK